MRDDKSYKTLEPNNKLDEAQFEKLFFEYYTPLCRFSLKFVKTPETAEEIVQDVFTYLWDKRHSLNIRVSYKSYLYTSAKNKSIDYLRSKYSSMSTDSEDSVLNFESNDNPSLKTEGKELERVIAKALELLPKGCYEIFALSRFGGLSNKEIAKKLDISIKTVENQMTKALKRLKAYVELHWEPILLLLFLYNIFLF